MQRNEDSMTLLRAAATSGTLWVGGGACCEWTVLLGFVSWPGESQGKSLSPLSDHTNRIVYSLLLFHCTGRVAECKYFISFPFLRAFVVSGEHTKL